MIGQDGKVRKVAKIYKGINYITDGKVDLSNGVANMLDKTYEEHIPQFELKEFDIAREQLNKQEQTQMLVRGNQEQMER